MFPYGSLLINAERLVWLLLHSRLQWIKGPKEKKGARHSARLTFDKSTNVFKRFGISLHFQDEHQRRGLSSIIRSGIYCPAHLCPRRRDTQQGLWYVVANIIHKRTETTRTEAIYSPRSQKSLMLQIIALRSWACSVCSHLLKGSLAKHN